MLGDVGVGVFAGVHPALDCHSGGVFREVINLSEQHLHVFVVPFETPENAHQSVDIIF